MIYERPARYRYATASNGKRYPTWPVWYREDHPIKKHFRTLDCEDAYDSDDFFKVEMRIASDPAYTEYISPNAKQRFEYLRTARRRAEAIVANINLIKQNAINRKLFTRAQNEFDFVWEPYRKALKKKYGATWHWKIQAKRAALYEKVWDEMRRLAWAVQKQQIGWELNAIAKAARPEPAMHVTIRTGDGRFAMRDATLDNIGHFGYGREERELDLEYIKRGMKWIDNFQNPYFTRIVVKIMDEQRDIRDQVQLLNRIETAAKNGQLQPLLEELNRRAGLYAA